MSYNNYRQTPWGLYLMGFFLALAVIYVFFQGSTKSARGIDPFTGKKLLIVWESYSGDEHRLFQEIARNFEKENPDLVVSVAQIPWMGQESKYRTSLIAGSPPDIGRVDTTFLPELVKNKVVEDLVPYLEEEGKRLGHTTDDLLADYVKAAMDSNIFTNHHDGTRKIYGIPDQVNGVCLFYNRQYFKEAGLDPDMPPKTWQEFIETAKKLTDPTKNRFGFGMDNSLWWSFPFFNTHGVKFLDDKEERCILNSPEGIAALQLKIDLFNLHKVEGGAWMSGGVNTEVGFINGKYAMILMGPWNVSRFTDSNIDFGVSLIPEGPVGTATNVGGTNMVVFKSSTNRPEAYRFLRYLTSPLVQKYWSDSLGQIPVNLRAFDLVNVSEKPILSTFMEQMKTAIARPKVLKYGHLEEIINPLMESALSGDLTAKQALDAAVKRINQEVLATPETKK